MDEPYRHRERFGDGAATALFGLWCRVIAVFGRPCSWLVEKTDKLWPALVFGLFLVTCAVVLWDFALYYRTPDRLDWLWITGYPVGLFLLFRSTDLPDRIFYLRQSLINQRILDIYDPETSPEPSLARERKFDDDERLASLLEALKGRVLPHTAVLTVLFCLCSNYLVHMIGLYRELPASAGLQEILNTSANHILGHVYILLGGLRLGRMVAFSLLMWGHRIVRLSRPDADGNVKLLRVRLNPQPGHPDGVCGLKKILDFWVFEASLLVPPLVYTLAWLAISGSVFCSAALSSLCSEITGALHYTRDPTLVFFWLTLILIVLQLLSLWWPVLALRMHTGHARHIVESRIDEIVKSTSQLRYTIANSNDAEKRREASEQLDETLKAYEDYRNIPLWPVAPGTMKHHVIQLWTIIVFLAIQFQEDKIRALIMTIFHPP